MFIGTFFLMSTILFPTRNANPPPLTTQSVHVLLLCRQLGVWYGMVYQSLTPHSTQCRSSLRRGALVIGPWSYFT